jgi:hypothetical protein
VAHRGVALAENGEAPLFAAELMGKGEEGVEGHGVNVEDEFLTTKNTKHTKAHKTGARGFQLCSGFVSFVCFVGGFPMCF